MEQVKKSYMLRILLVFTVFTAALGIPALSQEADEPLKYNVSVEALTFPVFAVDAQGNPVFDLKKEDINFSINGKTMDFQFIAFGPVSAAEAIKELAKETAKEPASKPSISRVNAAALRFSLHATTSVRNPTAAWKRCKRKSSRTT